MKKVLLLSAFAVAVTSPLWSCAPSDSGGQSGSGGAATNSGGAQGNSGGAQGNSGGAQGDSGGAPANTGGASSGGTGPGNSGGRGGTAASGGRANTGGANNSGGANNTGGAAGGAPGDLMAVATTLNGQLLTGPCLRDTQAAVCATVNGACPGANTAGSGLAGVLTADRTITLGGTPGTMYTISLHIQGEVESKQYGGMDQNSTLASPRADGFAIGGTPTNADAYNVYVIRVTNPGSTAATNYYLNSLQDAAVGTTTRGPGVSNHTVYGIDYMANIRAMGGATLRLLAADSNCSMIKNCGPIVNDGNTCGTPIVIANVEADAVRLNPTFNFTTGYNGQWVAITVKGVTSP